MTDKKEIMDKIVKAAAEAEPVEDGRNKTNRRINEVEQIHEPSDHGQLVEEGKFCDMKEGHVGQYCDMTGGHVNEVPPTGTHPKQHYQPGLTSGLETDDPKGQPNNNKI